MEILIMCNSHDSIAMALYQELSKKTNKVVLATAEELMYSQSWIHEIDYNGKVTTEIKLQNGKLIRSDKLKAAWNRIRFFSMSHFINKTDRYYAQNEMSALFFSFLKSIQKDLINPIDTRDLAVDGENQLYLKQQAIKAGLSVPDYHFTTSPKWDTSKNLVPFMPDKKTGTGLRKKAPYLLWQNEPLLLIEPSTELMKLWIVNKEVVNGNVIADEKKLKKLSSLLNKTILEVDFSKTAEGVKLSNINTFPVYAPHEVIEALAKLLLQKAKQGI